MKTQRSSDVHHGHARRETWEYRLLLNFTILLFVPIAGLSRLLPRAWRPLGAYSDKNEGIFCEARRAAEIVIPCVFMG